MAGQLKGKKVLVVDDEADLREIICEDLEVCGAEILQAANGREAYEIYNQHKPDAVVSDVRMPGGDGIEFLKRMRARDESVFPLIVLITGFADLTPEAAVELGVQGMLPKPFNLKQLRDLLIEKLSRG